MIWCIDYAQTTKNEIISVVSESYPHLEKGAMRDFESIMKSSNYWEDNRWNQTKHIYTFEGGSTIEFISVDTYGKAHGPRRDVLFVNECNNLDYRIVDQLITRTRKIVWLDWNPTSEFWFYTDMLPNRADIDFITLTYLDNEALDKTTVDEIESHKNNKQWWLVYGLGQLGEVETRIYTGWEIVEEIPHHARLEKRGMDFGYTNDPTAIVDVYYYNGGYILDEICYRKGMSNKTIADVLLNQPNPSILVVADSAEPKSIDEIKLHGVNIIGVAKTKGESKDKTWTKWSIDLVKEQRISVTARSVNVIREYRNYLWDADKDGNILNEPQHEFSHSMDAVRYGLVSILKKPIFKVPPPTQPVASYYGDREMPF